MNIQNVTISGSGVLGAQIAFQTAFHGFNVTVYDIKQELLDKLKEKFYSLGELYKLDLNASQQDVDTTIGRIHVSTDLANAVRDADIVIE
ncbi:MAG TPA: 3-hydroxyacyl-CoA dehydrogenase NAD-binding domain-containing protein, partial [Chryseolinea sp.]